MSIQNNFLEDLKRTVLIISVPTVCLLVYYYHDITSAPLPESGQSSLQTGEENADAEGESPEDKDFLVQLPESIAEMSESFQSDNKQLNADQIKILKKHLEEAEMEILKANRCFKLFQRLAEELNGYFGANCLASSNGLPSGWKLSGTDLVKLQQSLLNLHPNKFYSEAISGQSDQTTETALADAKKKCSANGNEELLDRLAEDILSGKSNCSK